MLFKDLSPLAQSPSEIARTKFEQIKSLFPTNPFQRTEKEMINEYDSSISMPQLVFLGMDEGYQGGLRYQRHSGAPYFALDITPKGSFKQQAEDITATLERQGLIFLEGRKAMNLPADIGMSLRVCPKPARQIAKLTMLQLQYSPWAGLFSTGTHGIHSARPAVSQPSLSTLGQSGSVHQPICHLRRASAAASTRLLRH
jgi:hypothetical protein